MEHVLDAEPALGLVVLNGDLITGENTFLENSTLYVDQIVGPLVRRGLTWASTYGNHDSDYNISREAILARERSWPNARTAQMVSGPQAGVTNYYLPVYGPGCAPAAGVDALDSPCAPALLLWFFDSRGGFHFQQRDAAGNRVGQPDWVDAGVAAWFLATSAALAARHGPGGRPLPSLAFVHIPTNASLALQTEAGLDAHRQPGIDDDYGLAQQGQGWCADGRDGGTAACPLRRPRRALHAGARRRRPRLDGPLLGPRPRRHVVPHLGPPAARHDCGRPRPAPLLRPALGLRRLRHLDPRCPPGSRAPRSARTLGSRHLDPARVGRRRRQRHPHATYGKDYYPATPDDHTFCPTCNYAAHSAKAADGIPQKQLQV